MSEKEDNAAQLLKIIEEGVSASADSLAQVSHTNWETQTVSINSDSAARVQLRLKSDEQQNYGAFFSMPGAVFLLMFPKKKGPQLAQAFLGEMTSRVQRNKPTDDVCVAEISNIVVNAVTRILADACDEVFMLSAPQMREGKKIDLFKVAIDKVQTTGETTAIMTYVHLSSDSLSCDCTVILFMSPAYRQRILKALEL